MNAVILGASGGLAAALAETLLAQGSKVDLVTRDCRRSHVERQFKDHFTHGSVRILTVEEKYSDFQPGEAYDAHFFTQALFNPAPLASLDGAAIAAEIEVGLTGPIRLTSQLLAQHPPAAGRRRDYCYVGSTSAYAGFKNTSVYCAVKHGMLGFVRAMNDEYSQSDARFWLFSMGTMNTEMGAKLVEQDPASFLQPGDVARRIVEAIASPSNLFEPEVIIRRRSIRFREK